MIVIMCEIDKVQHINQFIKIHQIMIIIILKRKEK